MKTVVTTFLLLAALFSGGCSIYFIVILWQLGGMTFHHVEDYLPVLGLAASLGCFVLLWKHVHR